VEVKKSHQFEGYGYNSSTGTVFMIADGNLISVSLPQRKVLSYVPFPQAKYTAAFGFSR